MQSKKVRTKLIKTFSKDTDFYIITIFRHISKRLNFGLISVTMFVSMWISNTAAVAMMIPIMQAVLEELESVHAMKMFFKLLNCLHI